MGRQNILEDEKQNNKNTIRLRAARAAAQEVSSGHRAARGRIAPPTTHLWVDPQSDRLAVCVRARVSRGARGEPATAVRFESAAPTSRTSSTSRAANRPPSRP